MTDEATRPILVSQQALRNVAGLRLPGAQLATLLALLAHLDHTGYARITQPELCQLLGTGPGRVWQSLQALVAAGLIQRPDHRAGKGRATPYSIPVTVAVMPPPEPLLIPPLRKGTSVS
jgi:DNA-binding MarR family transcriptional regulator